MTDSVLGVIAGPSSGDDGDGILEAGETWVYMATGTWSAGQNTNTGTVTGDLASLQVSDMDDANYFGAFTSIDIEKLVSVDGRSSFVDAEAPTGPTLAQGAGIDPVFRFVLSNSSNVDLSNISVSEP